MTAITSISSL